MKNMVQFDHGEKDEVSAEKENILTANLINKALNLSIQAKEAADCIRSFRYPFLFELVYKEVIV